LNLPVGWRVLPHGSTVATFTLRLKNHLLLLRSDLQLV